MAGQNIIEFGFDVEKLTKQQTEILNILTTIYDASKKMDGVKIGLGNAAGYADVTKAMQNQDVAIRDVTGNIIKLQKKTEEQRITEQVIATDRRKNTKEQVQNELNLGNAYEKLDRQQKQAAKTAKDLAAQYGVNDTRAKGAAKTANDLSLKLKEIDKSTGDFHRKVGDYTGGIKDAFSEMGSKVSEQSGVIGQLGEKLMKFGPIGAAIGAGIMAIGVPLTAFWTGTQEGIEKTKIRMAEFGGAMSVLSSEFSKLGNIIDTTLFGSDEKQKKASSFWGNILQSVRYLGPAMMLLGKIPGVDKWINETSSKMQKTAQMAHDIAAMQIADEKEQVALIEKRAKINDAIVNAREGATDENKTLAEKIEIQQTAIDKSKELQELDVEAAKNENKTLLAHQKMIMSINPKKWTLTMEKELQESNAKIFQTDAEYSRKRLRLTRTKVTEEKALRQEDIDADLAVVKDKIARTDAGNKKILENERSTLLQRIAAERSIMQGKLTLNDASTAGQLKKPGQDYTKKKQILQEAATERFNIITEEAAQELKLRIDYAKRDAIAVTEIEKTKIQAQKDELNDELRYDSQLYTSKMNLQSRLLILQKLTNLDIQTENTSFDKQILESAKKTPKEIEAITEAHNLKLKELNNKAQFEATDATKKFYKEQLDLISLGTEQAENVTMAGFNAKYAALRGQSPKAASRGKDILTKQESISNIDTEIGATTKKMGLAHDQGDIKSEADFQKQLLDLTRRRIDAEIDLEKKKAEDAKALENATIELAKKSAEFIGEQAKNQLERKKNQLSEQLTIIADQKDAEIERINSSTLAESEKAIEIKRINAQALNEKKKIDIEERKLKQQEAKINKEMALFNAIIGVAQGVATSLAYGGPVGIALSIITAAMGAIEIASIASKPIPKMEKGGTVKKTGIVLTDEKGPEGYIAPGGSLKIGSDSGANLKYLKAGTRVIPNDVLMSSMLQASSTDFSDAGTKNDGKMDKLIQLTAANQAIMRKQNNRRNAITIHNNIGAGIDHENWLNKNVRF
jgi:hypothetical protein